jgi:hypothetical protein
VFSKASTFLKSEDGAVTVDWVVITAAVVSLAGIMMLAINGPTGDVGDGVGTYLTNYNVGE